MDGEEGWGGRMGGEEGEEKARPHQTTAELHPSVSVPK